MTFEAPPLLFLQDYAPGPRARLLRVSKGFRQVDVALAAGVTQAQVSALERGAYVPLSVERRIFGALERLS